MHLADTQLADDESPSRLVSFDSMGSTSGAYRPQEAWGCRMLNAAARTINKLHETKPMEFVLLGVGHTNALPPRAVREALAKAGIGLEFMDTPAAARMYNVLTAEGRRLAAALIAI